MQAVRKGRRDEFTAFGWAEDDIPDPQDEATYRKSILKLAWTEEPHRTLRAFYKELIRYRRENQLGWTSDLNVEADEEKRSLRVVYPQGHKATGVFFNFGDHAWTAEPPRTLSKWTIVLNSADRKWGGPSHGATPSDGADFVIPPHSFLVLEAPPEK